MMILAMLNLSTGLFAFPIDESCCVFSNREGRGQQQQRAR